MSNLQQTIADETGANLETLIDANGLDWTLTELANIARRKANRDRDLVVQDQAAGATSSTWRSKHHEWDEAAERLDKIAADVWRVR